MDRQSQLIQQTGESVKAHRAFLLWLMQAPGRRSLRAAARAIDYSETMLRNWRKANRWHEREQAMGAGADALAARAYATQYHRLTASKEVALVQQNMVVQYAPPGGPAPGLAAGPAQAEGAPLTEKAKAVQLHEQVSVEEMRARRTRSLHAILDGATARVAEALAANKIKVTVQDMLAVQRMRRELEAGTVATGNGNPMATSVRVEQAATKGGDVLGALAEDHAELGLILGTLQAATEASNVLPFPGGRQQAVAAGDEG